MDIDPTKTIEKQTGKFVIVAAINAADNKPYPLVVDPTTGELRVNAEFTGDVIVDIDLPEAVDPSLTLSLSGSQQQLAAKALKSGLTLKALSSNTDSIWVGGSGVAVGSNGIELEPGESVPIVVENADQVYYIGTAADKLCVIGG